MASDLAYGLLPDHLLLGLLLVLMLLETIGVARKFASILLRLALFAGCAVLWQQFATGYAAEPLPGEIRIDRFALLAKLVILACGLLVVARVSEGHVQVGIPCGLVAAGCARHHGQRRLHPAVHGHRDALAARVRVDRARRRPRHGSGRSIQVPAAFGGRERVDAVRHCARRMARRDRWPLLPSRKRFARAHRRPSPRDCWWRAGSF